MQKNKKKFGKNKKIVYNFFLFRFNQRPQCAVCSRFETSRSRRSAKIFHYVFIYEKKSKGGLGWVQEKYLNEQKRRTWLEKRLEKNLIRTNNLKKKKERFFHKKSRVRVAHRRHVFGHATSTRIWNFWKALNCSKNWILRLIKKIIDKRVEPSQPFGSWLSAGEIFASFSKRCWTSRNSL